MMKRKLVSVAETALLAGGLLAQSSYTFAQEPDWGFSVQLSATVQAEPPQITLQWEPDMEGSGSQGYTVYRKSKTAASWGNPIATLPGSALNYTDTSVAVGATYEYQVINQRSVSAFFTNSTANTLAYGYIYSGIQAPLIENRGTMVLLVESNATATLSAELAQLESDLTGDGWQVIRHNVSSNDTPAACRALVIADYNANPGSVNAVLLFGHIPILQSGMVNYDGHGARPMPADGFYGDMDGNWSGSPSFLPSDVELMVGRVDLADMPGATATTPWPSETELLRNYLNKDHAWRFKEFQVPRRALIGDRFGTFEGETRATSGYRNFEPFVGPGNIDLADTSDNASPDQRWISLLTTRTYLWTYGNGGGQDTSISELGLHGEYNDVWSTDMRTNDPHAVFFMLEGSHFGNWDHSDNIMRAVLATPTMGLIVCTISGRPEWYCHHVGLGEPIGYGARLSMNNSTLYSDTTNEFARAVYVDLMGDPSLRIDQVAPASNLRANANPGVVDLSWFPSGDGLAGYHVYRSSSPRGPFTRISSSLVTGTTFEDTSAPEGDSTYMVRAVALQTNPSGSYYNPSQGVFVTVNVPPSDGGGTNSVAVNPGSYNGLFYEGDQIRQNSAGAFTLTVTTKGSYSGRLQFANQRTTFSGKVPDSGVVTNSLKNGRNAPLSLQLNLANSDQSDRVNGTVSDGTWTANISADRAQFSSRTNPCVWAGSYTIAIPGAADNPLLPAGAGYATVRVNGNGLVNATVTLADNTKVTQSATLSQDGVWPFYAPLYSGKGSLLGWLNFADNPSDDLNGVLNWNKPAIPRTRYYPGGFGFEATATGSRYEPPTHGSKVLDLDTATLSFAGGNLAADFANQISIGSNNHVTNLSSNAVKMSFSPSTGRFSGSVTDPATSKSFSFSGVALQKSATAAGFALGTNQTSQVNLNP
jgi:hypothetical protein